MNSIEDLKEWIKEICYDPEKYILIADSGQQSEPGKYEKYYKFSIYTNTYQYFITATESSERSYLGCIVSSRKKRVGESWTRGNDLPDGKLTRETWEKIKDGIIKYELKPLEQYNISSVKSQEER